MAADPIDALIPPAPSGIRRGIIGVVALGTTIAVGLLWAAGAVVPAPFARTSFDGGSAPMLNAETGRVTIGTYFVNHSVRDLELEDVEVELAGATVVDVWVEDEPAEASGAARPLPTIIKSGGQAFLMIEMEIDACPSGVVPEQSSDEAWGVALLSFRFPDNFLPFGRGETLEIGSLADQAEACTLVNS